MNSNLFRIIRSAASIMWLTGLQASGLTNGSFEDNLTGWDTSGNVAVKSTLPYAPTHRTKLVAFNSMNTTGSAGLIQPLDTAPRHTYVVEFDVGNIGYNPQSQTLSSGVGGTMSTHGHVSQVVDTAPGKPYQLVVDMANLSYVALPQWIRANIYDHPSGYVVRNEAVSIPSTSTSGGTHWLRDRAFTFTTRDPQTRFLLIDHSLVTDGLDLVLDNVRLVPQ